ncbi:ubiquitin fusion degradation protein [Gurleya vavrai]
MFFNFFGRDRDILKWELKPKKFPKNDKNNLGGKCILPQRILEELLQTQVRTPYTFEISHSSEIFRTNIGVLEFTGFEGFVIVPEWIYQQLDLQNINLVTISFKKLPKGRQIKLLPHSVDFLEIEQPKGELEKNLRNYQVLTMGDEILCEFEDVGKIRFTVSSIEPVGDGIYIVDTDLAVEFIEPVGYAEKIEREKTIFPYVEVSKGENVPRHIKMKKFGLYFGTFDENK